MYAFVNTILSSFLLRILTGAGITITTYTFAGNYVDQLIATIAQMINATEIFQLLALAGFQKGMEFILSAFNTLMLFKIIKGTFSIQT